MFSYGCLPQRGCVSNPAETGAQALSQPCWMSQAGCVGASVRWWGALVPRWWAWLTRVEKGKKPTGRTDICQRGTGKQKGKLEGSDVEVLWKILNRNVFSIAFCRVKRGKSLMANSCGSASGIWKENYFASFWSSEVIVARCSTWEAIVQLFPVRALVYFSKSRFVWAKDRSVVMERMGQPLEMSFLWQTVASASPLGAFQFCWMPILLGQREVSATAQP